ncbi:uncharacterized protein [Brachyistius frenatus]|uniref:uncharacterized protein isoform X3 n=1 Tax=Brachyistius frenatus TaxID=100188 RepID=UPI0037E80605
MARHLLLIILFYSFQEINLQDLSQPKVTVSPPMITETDSVTLTCQTPPSVIVSQCDFYIANQKASKDVPCVLTLTGTELLKMAHVTLPAEVKVRCFYTVQIGAINSMSADSDTSTITVNNLLPPQLRVNPPVITETDSVTLNCQIPSSVSVTGCYFRILREKRAKLFSCLKTLTGNELLSLMRQSSPASVEVTCFYLLSHQSPESNMSSITIHSPPPELSVNPPVITETDSVTLNCQTTSSVPVAECFLYFISPKTAKEVSCLHTMTGTELLSMTHQSSPAEVEVTCYHTLKNKGQYRSPLSKVIHISIQSPDERITTMTQIMPTSSETIASSTSALLPVTTRNPTSQLSKWKLLVAAPACGATVGIIVLGVALVCAKRRSGKRFHNRSQANVMVTCR